MSKAVNKASSKDKPGAMSRECRASSESGLKRLRRASSSSRSQPSRKGERGGESRRGQSSKGGRSKEDRSKDSREQRDARGKRGQQEKREKRGRRGAKKQSRNFAVWRAVTLFPRPSLKAALSGLIYVICLGYAGLVAHHSYQQLKLDVDAEGLTRTYHARRPLSVPLPEGVTPLVGQLLDQRPINVWSELKRRSRLKLEAEPPLLRHADPEVNQKAWQNALKARKIDFVESRGLGSSGEVSLVWPPLPAPQPTLIVGHVFDQVVWVHPEHGIVISSHPPSWSDAPSLRLPPQMSRRW